MIRVDADGYYVPGNGGEALLVPQCPKKIQRGGGDGGLSRARGRRGGGDAGRLGLWVRSASCVEECEACPQATRFVALARVSRV